MKRLKKIIINYDYILYRYMYIYIYITIIKIKRLISLCILRKYF